MTKQSKDVERYLKEVGKQLKVAKKERRNFLEGYRSYIWDYIEEEGQPFDYNRLIRFFGAPASVAENYILAGNEQVCVTAERKYILYLLYGALVFWSSKIVIACTLFYATFAGGNPSL